MTAADRVRAQTVVAIEELHQRVALRPEGRERAIYTALLTEIAAQLADIAFELKRMNDGNGAQE